MSLTHSTQTPCHPTGPSARRASGRRRGYLLLEVIVSSAILAAALTGAMIMTRKASAVMQEANRESQAAQALQEALGLFLAHPYGTALPGPTENLTYGDIFRCTRTWALSTGLTEVTIPPNSLTYERLVVTITYNTPNGTSRTISGTARRYQI